MSADPIAHFRALFEEAARVCAEPEAMVLSTVDGDGRPSGRFVLLKSCDERGFVFFTNLGSRKAHALTHDPRASLCFYWAPLGKQIRVEGIVEPVTDAEADAYFATRPRDSQIGAWASTQSAAMASRDDLDLRIAEVEQRFSGRTVPRPPFWSGFRLVPHAIEFWTRDNARLHVRERYDRRDGEWDRTLLYP